MTVAELTPETAIDHPFVKEVVRVVRAHDTYGAWEGKSDAELLEPFVVTKEQRKQIPIMGDPDPDILWRLEMYYAAIGLMIEKQTKCMAAPMMKMSHEGWGRMILTTGRLVVINRHLRDVHRFGFESLEKMAEQGQKLVDDGTAIIEKFPEVARM